jgi:hypothetical protein
MPDLPTFNVTQSVADRILAAFSGQRDENGNSLTPAQAYKRWLRDNLAATVRSREAESDPLLTNDLK